VKKKIALFTLISFFVLAPVGVQAQGQGSGNSQAQSAGSSANTAGNTVQNQNQVSTKNQGEESALQVATMHMETLMDMQGLSEDTQNQVNEMVAAQKRAQVQTENLLSKVQSRRTYVKQLIGPDYKSLNSIRKLMAQNQLRIKALEQLNNEVVNQATSTQIEEAIQALVDQNTALELQVLKEEGQTSLFGWLFKFLSREVQLSN